MRLKAAKGELGLALFFAAVGVLWIVRAARMPMWEGFAPDNRQNWRAIIKLMKADGLIATTTYPFDVNLPSLITDAHSQ